MILLWEADKSGEVKQLMVPIKNWCIFAATIGTMKDTSAMAYNLLLLNRPLAGLKEAQAHRMNRTLGKREDQQMEAPPQDGL